MKIQNFTLLSALSLAFVACGGDDDNEKTPLAVPTEYVSPMYDANVTAESTVISELSALASDANDAESAAPNAGITSITYPANLSNVTLPSYQSKVDAWLEEIVKAANSATAFQTPELDGNPADGEEGGLLGTRLLDENGLELEQMVEKGSFGAACYNHALTVINGDLSSSASIDKLVEIYGTDASFDPDAAGASAKYAKRRSNNDAQLGFFYDIKSNLLTAKAAIEGGSDYTAERDQALASFLLNWEKSNFATVINYCNGAKEGLQNISTATEEEKGDIMHAYAEGVGFTHGFRGLSQKQITDEEIDEILNLLKAPAGETPESFRFLNKPSLITNLNEAIEKIQSIYGFSQAEVDAFFVNN